MANTRIGRTVSVAGSRRKATFSAWVKRTGLGESWIAKFGGDYSQGNMMQIGFNSADNCFIVGDIPSASNPRMESTRKFTDTNAWYHYVVAFDTTQNTASDRLKFYINGELITAYNTATYPTLNHDLGFNRTGTYNNAWLGGRGESTFEFNGLMSHVHWCDGYVYDASAFGSTDATTGEWKINTSPSVTYGTNGYFMLKDGNSLTDASGNGNNFSSLVGTLTKTEDNPSNVFATLNPLDSDLTSNPFQYGNTKVSGQNPESAKYYCSLTLGMMGNGKYYFEAQLNVNNQGILGVCNLDASDNPTYLRQQNTFPGRYSSSWGYDLTDGYKFNNNNKTDYGGGTSWSANDYISFALDNTNGKMYIAKNGSWVSGGNPTNGTGGIDYSAIGDNNMFIVADNNSGGYNKFTFNFGNGSFDTTTLSTTYSPTVGDTSAKFKYNIIPTGYTALSTKGLNS